MNFITWAMFWKWLRGGFVVALAMAFFPISAEAHETRQRWTKVRFARIHACPSTHLKKLPCPGYVIDHKKPLACGGRDSIRNMQWQTVAEGKAKDKWERKGCQKVTHK